MILTKEQFETQWAENTLTTTDWFDTTWALFKELEEAMKPKTCDGCKTLPFVLTELAKNNGGKCGNCKRYVKDKYEVEPKDTQC